MPQADPQAGGTRYVKFCSPAVRSGKGRVLLDHGGINYSPDDQENLSQASELERLYSSSSGPMGTRPSVQHPPVAAGAGVGTPAPPRPPVIYRSLSGDSPGDALTFRSTSYARSKGLPASLNALLLLWCLPDLAAIYCSFNCSLLNIMA